jgi:chemosensory pili system protein ChpA (sensor histidine kinase/response regulator)
MALPITPQPGTILVVEDCNDVRLGVAQLLELNGYRVTDAADGVDALARLSANPDGFALVLLDLLLPGTLSGRDLRARQLADPRLAQVPLVVVSACEPEVASQATLRPEAWLEKPFRGEQLLNVVRRFVRPEPGVGFYSGGRTAAAPELPAH